MKGATSRSDYIDGVGIYFNPRTREGCDPESTGCRLRDTQISIHAPVKGATGVDYYINDQLEKFQSTHP